MVKDVGNYLFLGYIINTDAINLDFFPFSFPDFAFFLSFLMEADLCVVRDPWLHLLIFSQAACTNSS